MDEGDPPAGEPSAAELGISEAERERILRDVQRRRGTGAPVDGAAHPRARWPARGGSPWARRSAVALLAVLASVLVVSLLRAGGAEDAPGSPYAFAGLVGGQPLAYTSCRPIEVAVYPAGGPADAEGLVREAVTTVRAATGLDLVVIGSYGGAAPNWNFESAAVRQDDPISVSWQDEAAVPEMTHDVAGRGGSRVLTHPDGSQRLVAGTIVLSKEYYAVLDRVRARDERLAGRARDEQLAVLLHEFGHVLGLAHVEDPGELMHRRNVDRTSYGPGDLAGLRRLGQGRCF